MQISIVKARWPPPPPPSTTTTTTTENRTRIRLINPFCVWINAMCSSWRNRWFTYELVYLHVHDHDYEFLWIIPMNHIASTISEYLPHPTHRKKWKVEIIFSAKRNSKMKMPLIAPVKFIVWLWHIKCVCVCVEAKWPCENICCRVCSNVTMAYPYVLQNLLLMLWH